MRTVVLANVFFGFLIPAFCSPVMWKEIEKKIAEEQSYKNYFFKKREALVNDKIKQKLDDLYDKKRSIGKSETKKIFKYVDKKGKANFSDRLRHDGYKPIFRDQIRQSQKKISFHSQIIKYEPFVSAMARKYVVPKDLVLAVIAAESSFKPKVVSKAGAVGLMQLMPGTARRYGVKDSYNAFQNIRGGTRYLGYLLKLFNNDFRLALAAYNAGENAVIRYGRKIPPYSETRKYVVRVLKFYREYSNRYF